MKNTIYSRYLNERDIPFKELRNYGFGDFCDTMYRRIEKNIGIVGDNL